MTNDHGLPSASSDAGDFAAWYRSVVETIEHHAEAVVPCGDCIGCCTSSQFVHISPDEADTLAHVPRELRFPAPGLPKGHVLLGFDHRGRCPMLVDGTCSIYAHRPRTCRVYDCRIFVAAGVEPDEERPAIADRARRWRFSYASPEDERRHGGIRAAARYLGAEARELPDEVRPRTATQLAVMAVEVGHLFVTRHEDGTLEVVDKPARDQLVRSLRRLR